MVAATALAVTALAFPRVLLVLALLATMFPQRVGPEALNLSVTDAVGVLGLLAALRFVPWHDRRIRLVLGGLAIYLGCLAVSFSSTTRSGRCSSWSTAACSSAAPCSSAWPSSGRASSGRRCALFMLAMAIAGRRGDRRSATRPASSRPTCSSSRRTTPACSWQGFLVAFAAGRSWLAPQRASSALRVLMLLGLAATQSRAAALGLVAALAIRPLLLGREATSALPRSAS